VRAAASHRKRRERGRVERRRAGHDGGRTTCCWTRWGTASRSPATTSWPRCWAPGVPRWTPSRCRTRRDRDRPGGGPLRGAVRHGPRRGTVGSGPTGMARSAGVSGGGDPDSVRVRPAAIGRATTGSTGLGPAGAGPATGGRPVDPRAGQDRTGTGQGAGCGWASRLPCSSVPPRGVDHRERGRAGRSTVVGRAAGGPGPGRPPRGAGCRGQGTEGGRRATVRRRPQAHRQGGDSRGAGTRPGAAGQAARPTGRAARQPAGRRDGYRAGPGTERQPRPAAGHAGPDRCGEPGQQGGTGSGPGGTTPVPTPTVPGLLPGLPLPSILPTGPLLPLPSSPLPTCILPSGLLGLPPLCH